MNYKYLIGALIKSISTQTHNRFFSSFINFCLPPESLRDAISPKSAVGILTGWKDFI